MEDYKETRDQLVKAGYRTAFYKSMLNKILIRIGHIQKKIDIEDSKPSIHSYMFASRASYITDIANYNKLYNYCKKRLKLQINIINKWIQE